MKTMLPILLVATCAAAAAQGAALDRKDREFIEKAAGGGMEEVQAGKLAETKAGNPEVKAFAAMLVKDHSANNEELRALAQRKGVTLPSTLPHDQQEKIDKMQRAKDFDRSFIKIQGLKDHKEDIKDFEKASKQAKDPDVKAYAEKTLPVLRKHWQRAEELSTAIKG